MTDAATDTARVCPWRLLGVSPDDDPVTIREAWRALVRSYHPDLARTDRAAANRKLAEINAAFDAVCDQDATRHRFQAARQAQAARMAEAKRRAYAAQQARAAREDEAARQEERAYRDRATLPTPRPQEQRWSRTDILAARAARLAFEGARRVLEAGPGPRRPAIYL